VLPEPEALALPEAQADALGSAEAEGEAEALAEKDLVMEGLAEGAMRSAAGGTATPWKL